MIVRPAVVRGTVVAPPSKSYTHRALTVSLLASGRSRIWNPSTGKDVKATLKALKLFGAQVSGSDPVEVNPPDRPHVPDDVIDCFGSGTTMRFMISVSSLTPYGYTVLTGNESLRRRPMSPLLSSLPDLGGEAFSTRMNGLPPIVVKGGGLEGGTTEMPGHVSSQFFSSLMIAGTRSERGVIVKPVGKLVSRPYLVMTSAVLSMAGVEVKLGDRIEVPPVRPGSLDFQVPGDLGLVAPLMVAASVTGGRLEVKVDLSMPQADNAILEVLKKFGVDVEVGKGRVIVEGRPRSGARVNLRDSPDLLPPVAVLAAYSRGRSVITGVRHARFKESDRIAVMARELRKAGVMVQELEDGLIVEGGPVKAASFDAERDHRVFMSLVALALGAQGNSEISGEAYVADSYPNFFEDLRKLVKGA